MNFVPNNFKVATLQLDLDCVTADVKLGTHMMPPSFLDFMDSESDIQTPASHSDGRVKAHHRRTYLWGAGKVANGNEQQVSSSMLTLIFIHSYNWIVGSQDFIARTTDNDRWGQYPVTSSVGVSPERRRWWWRFVSRNGD